MKKLLIFILCCVVGNVKAQSFCEVDSVYTMFDRETSQKVIQTSDGNFVIIGFSGLNGIEEPSYPKLMVTKLNVCGTLIWRIALDSFETCENCFLNVLGAWEQDDSSIIISSSYYYSNSFVKHYKITNYGHVLWQNKLKEDVQSKRYETCVLSHKNRFILAGNDLIGMNSQGFILISDSLGNVLKEDTLESITMVTGLSKTDSHTVVLIGVKKVLLQSSSVEDSLFVIKLNDDLNIISNSKIKYNKYANSNILYSINKNGTEILMHALNKNFDTTYFARINLNGNLIKETAYFGKFYYWRKIIPLDDYHYIIGGIQNSIIDSSLNFKWVEDTSFSIKRTIYNFMLTKDSLIISVGHGPIRFITSRRSVSDFWFGAKKLSVVWVKKLQITGVNFINQNSGSIQLSAEILPATATNKIINWSIDDTSKAFITQTGLLTAKANGVVKVVAKTTDGSNLSASKQITITNQGVGLLDEQWLVNQVNVFPNPANTFVSVQSTNVKINSIEIMDVKNKALSITYNTENIDISNFANGYYLLKVETEKGTVFKKLMIVK